MRSTLCKILLTIRASTLGSLNSHIGGCGKLRDFGSGAEGEGYWLVP